MGHSIPGCVLKINMLRLFPYGTLNNVVYY
jgi:hypothetical protein